MIINELKNNVQLLLSTSEMFKSYLLRIVIIITYEQKKCLTIHFGCYHEPRKNNTCYLSMSSRTLFHLFGSRGALDKI